MTSGHCFHGNIWDKVFFRNKDIVSRKIAGELFLVPVKGNIAHMEKIFTLSSVAAYIWDRLDGAKSLNDIRYEVMEQFDVGQEESDRDIQEFIGELIVAGLIHTGNT